MARPKKHEAKAYNSRMAFRCTADVKLRLEEEAARRGVPMTEVMAEAVEAYFDCLKHDAQGGRA